MRFNPYMEEDYGYAPYVAPLPVAPPVASTTTAPLPVAPAPLPTNWLTPTNPGTVYDQGSEQTPQWANDYERFFGAGDVYGQAQQMGYTGAMPVQEAGDSTPQQFGNPQQELFDWMQSSGNTYGFMPTVNGGQINAWTDPSGSVIPGTLQEFQGGDPMFQLAGSLLSMAGGGIMGGAMGLGPIGSGALTGAMTTASQNTDLDAILRGALIGATQGGVRDFLSTPIDAATNLPEYALDPYSPIESGALPNIDYGDGSAFPAGDGSAWTPSPLPVEPGIPPSIDYGDGSAFPPGDGSAWTPSSTPTNPWERSFDDPLWEPNPADADIPVSQPGELPPPDQTIPVTGVRDPLPLTLPPYIPALPLEPPILNDTPPQATVPDIPPVPEVPSMPTPFNGADLAKRLINALKGSGAGGGGGSGGYAPLAMSKLLRAPKVEEPLPKMFDPNYRKPKPQEVVKEDNVY